MIGTATALVTASAHSFALVSKELREWRKGDRILSGGPPRA